MIFSIAGRIGLFAAFLAVTECDLASASRLDLGTGPKGQECQVDSSALSCAAVLAQADGTTHGELSPRYEPAPPEPKSAYNDAYVFGMTRGLAGSTLHPGVKAPLFVLTIPLDIITLPFTAIGGFFG